MNSLITKPIRILIVDSDEQSSMACRQAFSNHGWVADHARTYKDAQIFLTEKKYDLVLVELILPDIEGTEAWEQIRAGSPNIVGIMMTSSLSLHNSIYVLQDGLLAYLQKPLNLSALCNFIEQKLNQQRVIQERTALQRQLSGLDGLLSSIARTATPEQVLKNVLTHFQAIFQFDWLVMYLLNEDGTTWTQLVQHRLLVESRELTTAQSEFVHARIIEVLHSLEPLILSDANSSETDTRAASLKELGLRDLALAPVQGPEQPYGVLAIINSVNSEALAGPCDIELLVVVTQTLALALDRARLLKQVSNEPIRDTNTGVCTPAYLNSLIEIEVERWKRYHRPFVLVLMDTATFQKQLDRKNPISAQVLTEIISLAQRAVRRSDIIAQLQDRRLALLLSETELHSAEQVVNRIHQMIQTRLGTFYTEPLPAIESQITEPIDDAQNIRDMLN